MGGVPFLAARAKTIEEFHNPVVRQIAEAGGAEPSGNWRGFFLSGSSPRGCARIATTPATVRSARGAAIVEGERDESAAPARAMKLVEG